MIWKINLGLAGICGLLAAYGFHHSKILKPSEIFMYFLGNVLLYFFTKNIMGTYKELVEKVV